MRARVVRSRSFRSFVTSIAMTWAAGGLFTMLPSWKAWVWSHYLGAAAWDVARQVSWVTAGKEAVLVGFLLAAIVPWLVMFRRDRAREVEELGDGRVRIGGETFTRDAITGASVAPDGRGTSVAIGRGAETTFVEVDRAEDARRLLGAVGVRFPGRGALEHQLPRGSFVFVQGIFTACALLFATFAAVSILPWQRNGFEPEELAIFAVPLAVLTTALAILRIRKPMPVRWGEGDATRPARALDRSPIERHVRRHLEGRLTEDAAPRVRVDLIERRDETTKAWLARVDAMKAGDAYRGDALPKEMLWEIVGDEKLAVDARVAAARLLSRRDGEAKDAIRARVTDDEVRARVEAVLDDALADDAAARLDEVGPLFKSGE